MVIAVVGAGLGTAILSGPTGHASAGAIEANTMTSAVSGASAEGAIGEGKSREADALAVHAGSVARAVIVTGLTLDTSDHKRCHHEDNNFESHLANE